MGGSRLPVGPASCSVPERPVASASDPKMDQLATPLVHFVPRILREACAYRKLHLHWRAGRHHVGWASMISCLLYRSTLPLGSMAIERRK
jgi:hypothetical protein